MRLWHKDLIPFLPDDQLLGQWRECCAIASNLATYGEPHHILVNRLINYTIYHFWTYSLITLRTEFVKRGYSYSDATVAHFINNLVTYCGRSNFSEIDHNRLFEGWHSTRYLQQCILNLEEKFDCGSISLQDWFKLLNCVKSMSVLCNETYESLFV